MKKVFYSILSVVPFSIISCSNNKNQQDTFDLYKEATENFENIFNKYYEIKNIKRDFFIGTEYLDYFKKTENNFLINNYVIVRNKSDLYINIFDELKLIKNNSENHYVFDYMKNNNSDLSFKESAIFDFEKSFLNNKKIDEILSTNDIFVLGDFVYNSNLNPRSVENMRMFIEEKNNELIINIIDTSLISKKPREYINSENINHPNSDNLTHVLLVPKNKIIKVNKINANMDFLINLYEKIKNEVQ